MVTDTPKLTGATLEFIGTRNGADAHPSATAVDDVFGDPDRSKMPFVDEEKGPDIGFIAVGCALVPACFIAMGFLFAVGQTLWAVALSAALHVPLTD